MEEGPPPDAAVTMLYTKWLNGWAHTNYTFEQVSEFPPILFDILASIEQGLNPEPVK